MRNLVKTLAFFALVVVLSATAQSIFKVYAAIGTPPPGTVCLYNDPSTSQPCFITSTRTQPAGNDPDINILLRQLIRVPGTPNIIDFAHDTAPAPQLCHLFDNQTLHPFTSLYAVGIVGGVDSTKKVEPNPPHTAAFETQPGESIHVPPLKAYGGVGGGYDAMVLFIGHDPTTNSDMITIKYTLDDNVVKGYTIHIFGITIDPALKSLYDQANSAGRWYLPGLTGDQVIGTAKGSEFWTIIRDTGQFMDPRWYRDWWKDCGPHAPDSGIPPEKVGNPPGFTTTPATPISSVAGPTTSGTSTLPGGKYPPPVFPPLGTLEACPTEIPTPAPIGQAPPVPTKPGPTPGFACANIHPIPQPDACKTTNGSSCSLNWMKPRAFCYPSSCSRMGGNCRCGVWIDSFCRTGWVAQLWPLIPKATCGDFVPGQIEDVNNCLGFYQSTGAFPNGGTPTGKISDAANISTSGQTLPACVPTNKPRQTCVSECSEPVNLTENLLMFSNQGCARSGDCLIKVGVKNNSFNLPFVKNLADYFAGILDAEHMSPADLDNMQKILRAGSTDPSKNIDKVFAAAGVNRKLLPQNIQDQLKCQFIDYVKRKKTPNTDGSYPNTKYLGHTSDGKLDGTELMVYDQPITEINCPPTVNPNSKYPDRSAWEKDWGKYWFAVPLYQNDDSQGKIEFASPTIFSTRELGNDPKYPKNELGPVYVSLPEVARLASATAYLQMAFVPQTEIIKRAKAIGTNPKSNLPTFGKTLDPSKSISACTTSNWSAYYNNDSGNPLLFDPTKNILIDPTNNPDNEPAIAVKGASGAFLTEYTRAVTCDLIATTSASLVSKVCVIGPTGQLRCYLQNPTNLSQPTGVPGSHDEVVQVRTVFPDLFEIAEQTIQKSTGFLRMFKPETVNVLNQGINKTSAAAATQDEFEKNYDPIPAYDKIQYDISDRTVTLKPPKDQDGWKIFFYRLGGLWQARNFILELLWPASTQTQKP